MPPGRHHLCRPDPQGKIAMGKLAQALMHGAKIIQIDGNFDDCLEMA